MAEEKDLMSYENGDWVPKSLEDVNADLSLNSLKDIIASGLANKFILVWDSEEEKWKVSHAGDIATEVSSETDLIELKDVNLNDKRNGQSLLWDSVSQSWINRYITLEEIATFGIQPGANSGDILVWDSVLQYWVSSTNQGNEIYSLDETVIGTWIEDQLLYRKVIKFKTSSLVGVPTTITIGSSRGFPTDASLFTRVEGFHTCGEDLPLLNDFINPEEPIASNSSRMRYSSQGQMEIFLSPSSAYFSWIPNTPKYIVTLILEYVKEFDPVTTTTTSTTSTTTTTLPGTTSTTTSAPAPVVQIIVSDTNIYDPVDSGTLRADILNKPVGAIIEWTLLSGPVPPYPTVSIDPYVEEEINQGYSIINLSDLEIGTYSYQASVKMPGASSNLATAIGFFRRLTATTTTTSTTTVPGTYNNILEFTPGNAPSLSSMEAVFGFEFVSPEVTSSSISFNTSLPYELDTTSFIGMNTLKKIKLQVVDLNNTCFSSCGNLVEVDLPNIFSIPEECFYNNFKLTDVYIPNLQFAGDRAFADCGIFDNIDFPKLQVVSEELFSGCTSAVSIYLPDVHTVKYRGFFDSGITGALQTTLPELTSIGDNAFENCINLTSILYITPQITGLGDSAFIDCTGLTSAVVTEIKKLGLHSFRGCTSLTSISFEDVQNVGSYAFYGCIDLVTVSLPSIVIANKYSFYGCTSLSSPVMTALEYIGDYSFYSTSLSSMVSMDNVTHIGNNAFENTELVSMQFPNCIYVGAYAFKGCTDLTNIELPILEELGPTTGYDGVFEDCIPASLTVKVPTLPFSTMSPIDGDLDIVGLTVVYV